MKEFDFLLGNKKPAENIQVLDDSVVIKKNICSAIRVAARVDVKVYSKRKNAYINGGTVFLKILQRGGSVLLLTDKLMPDSLVNDLIKNKIVIFLYAVDKVWCAFKTTFAGYDKKSGYFVVKFPSIIWRQQRRRFFRVSTIFGNDINISFKNKFGQDGLRVFDISEGGLSFKAQNYNDFVEADVFEASLYFSSGIFINVSIEIKVVSKEVVSSGTYFKIGVEFVCIENQDRELIAKYILERQIEEIHKRKKVTNG